MQNKIGFVGVGQCGSNIAQLFEHLNYTCVCINSSEKDFKPLNTKYNYCTPKTDGCNHDRKKAITILQKYYKNILNVMLKDLYLRTMMKAKLNYEINFRKFMDEGKSIIIQLPEHTFTNKSIKDTIITYFMSRIWLSALQRNNDSKVCHIITDEIHQAPTCCNLLSSIIVEGRKFGIDFYFTTHYLKQFKTLLDAIKSAGTSYMLLAGTEKENFALLKEELMPYDIEDGLELESFTSLNLINWKNKYVRFISKLPHLLNDF